MRCTDALQSILCFFIMNENKDSTVRYSYDFISIIEYKSCKCFVSKMSKFVFTWPEADNCKLKKSFQAGQDKTENKHLYSLR